MLHFDANPVRIGYLVIQSYEPFITAENNIKPKNVYSFLADISKTIFDSFPLIMSHISSWNGNNEKWRHNIIFHFFYYGIRLYTNISVTQKRQNGKH